jgi:hypothetical protein
MILTGTSSAVLNSSVENRHPCLIPYLMGKAFSLSSVIIMLPMSFSEMTFIRL